MRHCPALLPRLPLALALILALAGGARADEELSVRYRGILLDTAGLRGAGTVSLTFRFYESATPTTGETVLFTATPLDTFVGPGGEVLVDIRPLPATLFATRDEVFVGISVDGGEELTPRTRYGAAAIAHVARKAEAVTGRTACDCNTVPVVAGALAACTEGRLVAGLEACAAGSSCVTQIRCCRTCR